MKTWAKILMWLGLGGATGFFAGYQVGHRMGYQDRARKDIYMAKCKLDDNLDKLKDYLTDIKDQLNTYQGGDYDGDSDGDNICAIHPPKADDWKEEDVPPMPTEEEVTIDPDIPQLHPTQLEPEIISEEEFNANLDQFDVEFLTFYELDEVLYNETTQTIIENPDNVIGIGTLFAFGGDPNNPVDTLYIRNRTFGTYFRVDRVDGAFIDIVDGQIHPEDDEPDESNSPEEFTEDDYWDDV